MLKKPEDHTSYISPGPTLMQGLLKIFANKVNLTVAGMLVGVTLAVNIVDKVDEKDPVVDAYSTRCIDPYNPGLEGPR